MRANTLSPVTLETDSLDVGGDTITNLDPQRGKNLLINGDFGIWQRGTSFSAGVFTADRWLVAANGGDTITTTQQSGGVGTNFSGHNAIYTLQMSITAGGGTDNNLINYIEDVRIMQGKTVTLSAWIYSNVAFTLTPYLAQIFGAGGSGNVIALIDTKSIPQSVWTKITMTGTLPSISGKTIGTSSNLAVVFQIPGNVTHAVYFMNVQLESGDVATDFGARHQQTELALCQRYYQAFGISNSVGCVYNAAYILTSPVQFATTMRETPTMTISGESWLPASGGSWGTIGSLYSTRASKYGINPVYNTSGGTVGYSGSLAYSWVADAEF